MNSSKMKEILFILCVLGVINNANALDLQLLAGDTRSSCEVILCLASPVKPPKCASSLAKYFAIHFRKPCKTINARKEFLNLCPIDTKNDPKKKQ